MLPVTAFAHATPSGSNSLLNGILHTLGTPAHVLLLLSYALLASLQRPPSLAAPFKLFLPISAIALVTASFCSTEELPTWLPTVLTLACGGLAAAAVQLPGAALLLLSGLMALVLGFDSGFSHPSLTVMLMTLTGSWLTMNFIAFEGAWYLAHCQRNWQRTGLRVASSWTVAISVLLLAFSLRGNV